MNILELLYDLAAKALTLILLLFGLSLFIGGCASLL